MKVLYILKESPIETEKKIIEEQKKLADVTVIDLKADKDYDKIIDLVTQSDKVVSW